MRAALIVEEVGPSVEANLEGMVAAARRVGEMGAELVLFPEAALTGLINDDDPARDLPLGRPIPGPETERLGAAAREGRLYVATGLLEWDGDCLYDSAVLFDPTGDLILTYRRIQPQWHGRDADPHVYRQGNEVVAVATTHGRMAVLLCGDLFDDGIVAQARALAPDHVLVPMSRSFSDGSFDQERWERNEEPQYVARAALLGCTVLIVNQLESREITRWPAFGGAWVVGPTGEVVARWPLGRRGVLWVEA